MAASSDSVNIAMFCDFENVALGVRDAKYDKFDIKPVLERLLLKGAIVVKKAYCDWERYKGFKAAMHEANFELIEIPHVRQSGKNSADIRMVVDALDLCYTKSHVDTFVIVSGDSDFSPLVSKLRENAKHVIGVGIKQSTSDLLIANCDEFIFYDDLVRENHRSGARRDAKNAHTLPRLPPEELEARKTQAIDLAVETFEALVAERGESGKIWASMLKEAIKRRKPDFNESFFGFRSFGNLLDEAQTRGLLEIGRDEKSGAFVSRGEAPPAVPEELSAAPADAEAERPAKARGRKRSAPGETTAAVEPRSSYGGFGSVLEEAQARGLLEIGRAAPPVSSTPGEAPAPGEPSAPAVTETESADASPTARRRSRNRNKRADPRKPEAESPAGTEAEAAPPAPKPAAAKKQREAPGESPKPAARRPRRAKAAPGGESE